MFKKTSSLPLTIAQSSDAAQHIASALQSAIFNNATISSMAFDAQGVIQEFNLGAQRMLGYSAADVAKQLRLADLCDPLETVTRATAQSLASGATTAAGFEGVFELTCIRQDGHRLPVMASVMVFQNDGEGGAPVYLLAFTDNTAHQRLQALETASTHRLQKIASRLPGMVYQYRLHPDGRSCFPYASAAIRDIYRVTPQDVRDDASCVLSLLHPDDRDGVIASIQKSALDLAPWQHEYRVQFANGTVHWLLGNALPEREADGATLWHGFITDITERKTTEKALRLSERRIRATLDAIPDLMFELDLEGRCHDFHSPRTDFLVAPAQNQIGQLVSDVLPANAAQVVMAALQEAHEQGYASGQQFKLKLVQGDMWFELSVARKVTEPGESPRFIVLSRDITERLKAKESLRISDLALKSISQGVLISDPDGRILSANDAFLSITGFIESEILGRTCSFAQGPKTDSFLIAAMRHAQFHATEFSGVVLNYRKDGSTFWNDLSITPMFDAEGQVSHFIGITRDITTRKLAQEELDQHHNTLEQLVTTRTAELGTALTASKVARDDLLRSQLTLEQATHLAQLGAWSMELVDLENFDTNPSTWSAEMFRLLDYRPQDVPVLSPERFFARVHPLDRQRIQDMAMKSLAEKCPWETEYRIIWADGSEHLVVQTGKFIVDQLGNPISMHGAVKDITAQRQLETQLREREAQLQTALKGASAGSFEWHIETGATIWSKEVWALNGLEPDGASVSYEAWRQTVIPEDLTRLEQITQLALPQRAPIELEWQVKLPPGVAPRWLMSRAQPIPEDDGQVLRYRGIIIDITQRRQAELTLERYKAELEERVAERTAELVAAETEQLRLNQALRLISECNIAVIHAQDENHLLQELCRLVVETGGYQMAWVGVAEQDAAKTVRPLAAFGDAKDFLDGLQVSWDAGQPGGCGPTGTAIRTGIAQVSQHCASNAQMTPLRIAALSRGLQSAAMVPLMVNGVAWGVLSLFSADPEAFDETEMKILGNLAGDMAFGLMALRTRAQLEVHQQQLEALVSQRTQEIYTLNTALMTKARDAENANHAKGAFLASMSHELRTPLNAVIGLTGLLVGSPLGRRQRDYANKIQLSAQALRALIDDILDFSKIEAGELRLEQAPFSLNAILRTTAAVVGVGLGHKPVEAVFEVGADVPDALIGDALRLQQILLNLTSNAVKFTSTGDIVIAVRRFSGTGTAEGAPVTLQFSVRDTGIGIEPEQLGSIFNAFTQADASTSRNYGGSGLGLAISDRLATLMGGQIGVKSVVGWGSEFHFEVPLTQGRRVKQKALVGISAGFHILIVDDHPRVRDMLTQTCVALGWQATAVASAAAGLAELQRSNAADTDYDLLLLDWRMPGMDGLEMLRQAYATPGLGLPQVVLMASIVELEQVMLASVDLNLDGIAAKPLTPASLQEALLRVYSGENVSWQPMLNKNDLRLAGMRLLVAEDNVLNQEVIEQMLTQAGAEVMLVGNGAAAVAALRLDSEAFDAVLMDIQMPLMDGYTATRIIREELGLRALPIIAVTAFAQPEDREKSRLAGMVGHVAKPLDIDDLVDLLDLKKSDAVERLTDLPHQESSTLLAPLPLAVLDVTTALSNFCGDKKRYGDILSKFLVQHGGDVDEIRRLYHLDDRAGSIRLLHDLSGVASFLQAKELARLASAGEAVLRSGQMVVIPGLFEALQTAMQMLQESIQRFETPPVPR